MKSDLEIARSAKIDDIYCITRKAGILDEEVIPWGNFKAKVSLDVLNDKLHILKRQ